MLDITNGETPSEAIEPNMRGLSIRFCGLILMESALQQRKNRKNTALTVWDTTVATAAPLTPKSKTFTSSQSSRIFVDADAIVVNMTSFDFPCATMNGASPIVISTEIVPIR